MMKCHGCSSLMVLDKQETGTGSSAQWHSCPLCGKVRLTSQPETHLESTPPEAPLEAYEEALRYEHEAVQDPRHIVTQSGLANAQE